MPNTSIPNSAMLGLEDNDALLTYRVGPVYCCGPTLPIVTITPPPPLTHPPGTSIAEPGIFKHGSLIVSATDLRYRFGVKQEHWKQPGQVIIAQHNNLTRGYFVDEIKDVISMPDSGWRPLPSHLPRGVFSRTLFLNDNIYLYAEFDKLSILQDSGYLTEYIAKLEKAEEDKKSLESTTNKYSARLSTSGNISHKTTNDSVTSNPVASNKTTTDTSASNPVASNKAKTDASNKATTDASTSNPVASNKTTTDTSTSNPVASNKTTTDTSTSNSVASNKTTTDTSASNPIISKSKFLSNDKTTNRIKNTNKTLSQNSLHSTYTEAKTTKIKPKDKVGSHKINKVTTIKTNSKNKVDMARVEIKKDKTTQSTTHGNTKKVHLNKNNSETQQVPKKNTTSNKNRYQKISEQEEPSGIGFVFLFLIMLFLIGGGYYYYTQSNSKSTLPKLAPTETVQIEFVEETNLMSYTKNNQQESITNNSIDSAPEQLADAGLTENKTVTKEDNASYINEIPNKKIISENNYATESNLKAPEYHAKINKDNDTITIELGGPLPPKIKSIPTEELNTSETLQEANPPVKQPSMKDNHSLEINIIKQPYSETSDSEITTAESNNDKTSKTNSMEITHVIVKGDTLWAIAKHYLQNPFLYPELAKLSKIKNPDLIYPGNLVRIIYRDNKK